MHRAWDLLRNVVSAQQNNPRRHSVDFHLPPSVGQHCDLEVPAALELYRHSAPQRANTLPGSVPRDKAARGHCCGSGGVEEKRGWNKPRHGAKQLLSLQSLIQSWLQLAEMPACTSWVFLAWLLFVFMFLLPLAPGKAKRRMPRSWEGRWLLRPSRLDEGSAGDQQESLRTLCGICFPDLNTGLFKLGKCS